MQQEQAETIALQALTFLAADEDALAGLLRMTGISLQDLARNAADPSLLGGILDFLMQREERLLAFCDQEDIPPHFLQQARHALPGGALPPLQP
ncbi:MAG: hypothetical protein CMF31_08280 [Kordiimonas sp.]|nr:hypothetical protein [Kordiimonas sp.]